MSKVESLVQVAYPLSADILVDKLHVYLLIFQNQSDTVKMFSLVRLNLVYFFRMELLEWELRGLLIIEL